MSTCPFRVGDFYSRQEIHREVRGGSLEEFLPNKNGCVLAACLRTDANPGAPGIILPGDGERIIRAACLLVLQDDPIPVFVKCRVPGPQKWRYEGMYRVNRYTTEDQEIEAQERLSRRDDITMVIYMTQVAP